MLRKLLRAIFYKPISMERTLAHPHGKRIYREFHGLRREQMDVDALKVIHRLSRHGYRAYLVGGCVRDMLLKKYPKDFDIATSATPEQVRRIFSNSRSIGRRFRIVHILFRGEKIIEVSTFRSLPKHRLRRGKSSNYLLRRDNRYGNPQQDAGRRDFTINGLYYDPRNESIIDYVGGYADIQRKSIQAVGDANISFQEDPIRMLRAAKFAALLDFKVASKTASAIRRHRGEIRKANRSRLLDEFVKIFRTGRTAHILNVLHDLDLFKVIFPEVCQASRLGRSPFSESSLGKRLHIADKSLAEREELTVVIFLALIFADLVKEIFSNQSLYNKADYVRKQILPVCRQMMLSARECDRLVQIYISHPRLLRDPHEKHSRPDAFRKKIFFYEAFMFFKFNAIAQNNEENIQKAMFWEIGPRMAPPEWHRAISVFPTRRNRRNNSRYSFVSPAQPERQREQRNRG